MTRHEIPDGDAYKVGETLKPLSSTDLVEMYSVPLPRLGSVRAGVLAKIERRIDLSARPDGAVSVIEGENISETIHTKRSNPLMYSISQFKEFPSKLTLLALTEERSKLDEGGTRVDEIDNMMLDIILEKPDLLKFTIAALRRLFVDILLEEDPLENIQMMAKSCEQLAKYEPNYSRSVEFLSYCITLMIEYADLCNQSDLPKIAQAFRDLVYSGNSVLVSQYVDTNLQNQVYAYTAL